MGHRHGHRPGQKWLGLISTRLDLANPVSSGHPRGTQHPPSGDHSQPSNARHPRKRFGQNFLQDYGVIDKIVRAIAPRPEHLLVEIGPGRGALTEPLLELCPSLQVVELDRDLAAQLRLWCQRYPDFKVHEADALDFDFAQLRTHSGDKLRIVGNLPYNISTPLLFHLLDYQHHIEDMHFMLQQEVVDRLSAVPGSKAWGRLSVMVQYSCKVEPLFSVAPHCFYPQPKVNSTVVRLQPQPPRVTAENLPLFRLFVNHCFQQRRKTLRNSLRSFLRDNRLATSIGDNLNLDTQRRPDTMSVTDFVALSNELHTLNIRIPGL